MLKGLGDALFPQQENHPEASRVLTEAYSTFMEIQDFESEGQCLLSLSNDLPAQRKRTKAKILLWRAHKLLQKIGLDAARCIGMFNKSADFKSWRSKPWKSSVRI